MAEFSKYERIFMILEYLARRPSGATLSTIAHDIGIPLSSCHDVLQRLTGISAISMTDERLYRLGSRSRTLAARITESEHLVPVSRRHLAGLAETLGFDVYLAVSSFGTVTYVDRFRSTNPVNVNVPLGQPLAIHATAAGKLFAAFDERTASVVLDSTHPLRRMTPNTIVDREQLRDEFRSIAARGFSQSNEEAILGVRGLAAPVFGTDDEIIAAIHVSALAIELDRSRITDVVDKMVETSKQISRDAH